MDVTVTTFYHFTPIADPAQHKLPLLKHMQALGIKGTVTLAGEGVNATVSGTAEALRHFLAELTQRLAICLPMQRESHAAALPFRRAKVKVKRELISLGVPANPNVCVGQYVRPEDWNTLIAEPDVVTIDTRNDYEYSLGHFQNALNPATRNFKEMVAFTENRLKPLGTKRVAMYCTGGIRCEKYSAYLLTQGFTEIYHLHGGILAYLDTIPPENSLWQGECFVFDERISVS